MAMVGVPGRAAAAIPCAHCRHVCGHPRRCCHLRGARRPGESGSGQHIDMALYDCVVSMHDYAVQQYTLGGIVPKQTGHDQPESTSTACSRRVTAISSSRRRWTRPGSASRNWSAATRWRPTRASRSRQPEREPAGGARLCAGVDDGSVRPRMRDRARRRVRAVRAGADDRPGARRSADQGTQHGDRAGPPSARPREAAEPAVPVLGLRHHRRAARPRSWASTIVKSRAISATRRSR